LWKEEKIKNVFARFLLIAVILLTSGCLPGPASAVLQEAAQLQPDTPTPEPTATIQAVPTRPVYQPGELVDYTAQAGDTLPVLAARFNTTVQEIRTANPIIPDSATTMPPGMPMKIPIYYRPLWGTTFQIIPDSLFVDGPAQRDFDAVAFVDSQPGWLKDRVEFAGGENRRGGEIINFVATNYSVSPRLLLALAEYQIGALSQATPPDDQELYLFGKIDYHREGFYRQLAWVADQLNNSYYRARAGNLLSFELSDGRMERPDPWQNPATVALQYYFSTIYPPDLYARAISNAGLAHTYIQLYGDPWTTEPHIPGSLTQPEFRLPFESGKIWAFTGGPHSAWGDDAEPLAAIDFAPPSVVGGCKSSDEWATAVADGVIARTGIGIAVLDLDGDGDERTGWVIFYLHLATVDRLPAGVRVETGDRLGHPSCEGGEVTGTHIHIARKYNGEWILADSPIPFNLEGWVVHNGKEAYKGTLTRFSQTVTASAKSEGKSLISSGQ
jgi:LysM repeat protein